MATHTKAIDVKRVTMWVELHAGIARIKKEQFVLNKATRDTSGVTSEEDFAAIETHLRQVAWYDIMPKTKATSVFDLESALESALKVISKHRDDPDAKNTPEQFDEAIKAIKAVKGKVALMDIYDVVETPAV
jgi:hypothetical protein